MFSWNERTIELPGGGSTLLHEAPGPSRSSAPTLVLLHGLGATARINWFTSIGQLGEHFRVIAFDQRGHGRGGPVQSGRFRLERCADDVAAIADRLGLDRLIPVGYSMGGAVAQLTWRRHPSRVHGLVLCATAGRFAQQRLQRVANASGPMISLAARMAPDSAWQNASRRFFGTPNFSNAARQLMQDELRAADPVGVLEASLAVAGFDSESWLPRIDVPTAVVLTTQDRHVPPARQQMLVDSIPNAKCFPVDSDHMACARSVEIFVPQLLAAVRWVADQPHRGGPPKSGG